MYFSKTIFSALRATARLALPTLGCLAAASAWSQPSLAYSDRHDFGATVMGSCGNQCQDGSLVVAAVVLDAAGNTYGTALEGGAYNSGVVWELTRAGVYKDLHDFGGSVTLSTGKVGTDGAEPFSGVKFDKAGNLYGTTVSGGAHGAQGGIIWELTANGQYKDLHDFGGTVVDSSGKKVTDGYNPFAGVSFDPSGNLYGVTYYGGANPIGDGLFSGSGVVWELTTAGQYVDVHDFSGQVVNAAGTVGSDGNGPYSPITFDAAGNMYGSTLHGGPNAFQTEAQDQFSCGMIWEITKSGVYKDLHDFGGIVKVAGQNATDSVYPTSVSLDASGNLFGTTEGGGPQIGVGNVWEITAAGQYESLHVFGGQVIVANGGAGNDGVTPLTGVTFDKSGNLFGTTYGGGAGNAGMVWEISAAHTYWDLHDFGGTVTSADGQSAADGFGPQASVTVADNGAIFGATTIGGPYSDGMLWRLAPKADNLVIANPQVVGGKATVGTVSLSEPAPTGGQVVRLASNSSAASVQGWIRVAEGATTASFYVSTSPVTLSTTASITANFGTAQITTNVTVVAPTVSAVEFANPITVGGNYTVATVNLNGVAATGGATINLTSSSSLAQVPASVIIAQGSSVATFLVNTSNVSSNTPVTISATQGAVTRTATLTIEPLTIERIDLSQYSVVGGSGTQITATISFNGKTTSTRTAVGISSSEPDVIALPSSVSVGQGSSSATFTFVASQVTAIKVVTIKANMGGKQVSLHLTVSPS